MKTLREKIDLFLEPKKIIVAGVSRNKNKFGYQIYKNLLDQGFDVCGINPNADEIEGNTCYRSLDDIPQGYDRLYIVTKPAETEKILDQGINKGIKNIWIQQSSENKAIKEKNLGEDVDLVLNECLFMHAGEVKNIHKFHRGMRKLFGTFPK